MLVLPVSRQALPAAAVVVAGLLGATPASAQESPDEMAPASTPAPPRIRLRYNLPVDLAVTAGMATSVLVWGLFVKPTGDFGSKTCTICDGSKGTVNALDDFFRTALKHDDIAPAATASHVLSYGVSPALGVALTVGVAAYDGRIDEAPLNALLVVEASLAAVMVKETLSLAIRRERPEVHALEGDAKKRALEIGDPLESFPSGHLASELAIMTAAGTIATMRGYRLAPLIWVVGGLLGATIAYLRTAADQHYFTDNVVGAAVGIGVGAAMPLLFHRPHRPHSAPSPVATRWLDGAMLTSSAVPGGGRTFSLGGSF